MEVLAIIPCAGSGTRMGGEIKKQFLKIHGKPILWYTLRKIGAVKAIKKTFISTAGEDFREIEDIASDAGIKNFELVAGGKERQDSVENALRKIQSTDLVLIHDAVRPLVSISRILEVIEAARKWGGAILAVPAKDTVKMADDGFVKETLPRESVWLVQTPQCFSYNEILKSYDSARKNNFIATDDSALFERAGFRVRVVSGDYSNIKITTPDDLRFTESILKETEG